MAEQKQIVAAQVVWETVGPSRGLASDSEVTFVKLGQSYKLQRDMITGDHWIGEVGLWDNSWLKTVYLHKPYVMLNDIQSKGLDIDKMVKRGKAIALTADEALTEIKRLIALGFTPVSPKTPKYKLQPVEPVPTPEQIIVNL